MDGYAGPEPNSRKVLAAGISLRALDTDGPPELGDLAALEEATAHAKDVSMAVRRFDYMEYQHPDEDWDPADAILRALKSDRTSILVVHIVAHGELSRGGERGLHVIGSDGKAFDDSVSSWINLIESYPDKPRPLTLFILDLCYSGAAAILPWHQEMPTAQRRAWVIAATGRESLAFDYRLSRATATVLNRYRDGTLRVDPSFEYIPLGDLAQEIKREVTILGAGNYPQSVEISRVPLGEKPVHLTFFRNPGYQPSLPSVLSRVDDGMAPMLDEAFDPRHFMSRGAGTEALGLELGQGYFRGRDKEVRTLVSWLNGEGSALQLVIGKPGVGKSALLGVLICAAHPRLRDLTQSLWSSLCEKPAPHDRLAVVHARRRSLEEIADSLARQMGAADADRPSGGWDAEGLAKVAGESQQAPYTVVIDALDEADRPQDIAQALLMPLAQIAHAERGARVRLLVGTRRERRFARLMALAQATGGLIDLDEAGAVEVHQALLRYLRDLLVNTEYASLETYAAGEALAEAIAGRLTGVNDPADGRDVERPLGWGEFLVAGLYLRHILSLPVERDPARARQLGFAVPLELPGLLELDLARRGDQPWLRPVLAAVAHAEGLGMPERVIAYVAPRLTSPRQREGDRVPLEDLRQALDQAFFYLRRDIDTNATTLYRLFHEGLAERLRVDPYGPPKEKRGMSTSGGSPYALAVYEGLLDSMPTAAGGRYAWHVGDPYLLRHAAQHARDAGRVDELLEDPEFLIHGDPEAVSAVLLAARTQRGLLAAAVYRVSYGVHRHLKPEQRRQILALDAARLGAAEFSNELARWADWHPVWATGGQVPAGLTATLTGHTNRVTGVATAVLDGRTVAITTSRDGSARVWDLTTGRVVAILPVGTPYLMGVASAVVEGRPVVITTSFASAAQVWDLATGRVIAALPGVTGYGTGVATAVVQGRPVVITTSFDHTAAQVWDLATGNATATLQSAATLTDVATAVVGGRPVAITTSADGTARVWDLITGEATATLVGHTGRLSGVATAVVGRRPVAITTSADRTARVWDLATGGAVDTLIGHTSPLRNVATAVVAGRPVAVTTSVDGAAWVWDLATGQGSATFTDHTKTMTGLAIAVVEGRVMAITTSEDDVARVWDVATGQGIVTSTGHSDRVLGVATAVVAGRPVAITTSRDRTARIWDLITGRATAILSGHTDYVTGVATAVVAGRPVAITTGSGWDGTARVWDLDTGQTIVTFTDHTDHVTGVATAVLARRPVAVTTSRDRTARVWDPATGQILVTFTGHTDHVTGVATAVLASRPVAVTTSRDGTVRVWDLAIGRVAATFQSTATLIGHTDHVTGVATAVVEGRPVAITTSEDHTARIWDLATGQMSATLTGHVGRVTGVATAIVKGRPVAITTSEDHTARIWDLAVAGCQTTLAFPDAPTCVAVAANGNVVLGMGNEVIVIDLAPSLTGLP